MHVEIDAIDLEIDPVEDEGLNETEDGLAVEAIEAVSVSAPRPTSRAREDSPVDAVGRMILVDQNQHAMTEDERHKGVGALRYLGLAWRIRPFQRDRLTLVLDIDRCRYCQQAFATMCKCTTEAGIGPRVKLVKGVAYLDRTRTAFSCASRISPRRDESLA